MYCPNCGAHECDEVASDNPDVHIERGPYSDAENAYAEEADCKVLECRECSQEFIVL